MQKHNDNTIKTSGHGPLEKYIPLTLLKGLFVRGELETEQNCCIVTPSISFPFTWAAQSGAWRSRLCWDMVLIPAFFSPIDLNFLSLGLYNNFTSTYFLRASHLHSIQPVDSQGYPLKFSTGSTCYLHRCISYFDSSARGQYATALNNPKMFDMP